MFVPGSECVYHRFVAFPAPLSRRGGEGEGTKSYRASSRISTTGISASAGATEANCGDPRLTARRAEDARTLVNRRASSDLAGRPLALCFRRPAGESGSPRYRTCRPRRGTPCDFVISRRRRDHLVTVLGHSCVESPSEGGSLLAW